jgi:hypothetical protein
MKNEEELLEQKELREQLIGRIEVLEKVNVLFLIPQTDVASVKQVSDFYEVDESIIKMVYARHKDELNNDGVSLQSYKDFLKSQAVTLETVKGKAILKYEDGSTLDVPMRGLRVFPRRAILRIGMLLRDSQVAKEVRTQLLNIEEKTEVEVKIHDINEEKNIQLEIGMAYASGNPDTIMLATAKYMSFKNRHIEQLQHDNKALAGEILKWEDRSKINFAVRKLSKLINKQIGFIWNELYKELKYKHHIDVKLRGGTPYIQHIKKEEWSKVIQTFSAICEKNNISPSDILSNITEEV